MNEVNFIAGGLLGDFIHSLYVVKNICNKRGVKANLFIRNDNGSEVFRYGSERAHKDLYSFIISQPYINKFEIVDGVEEDHTRKFNGNFINLDDWRKTVSSTHSETGMYTQSWSEVLNKQYDFIPEEYKWVSIDKINPDIKGKTLIHRSVHHHNTAFPWNSILSKIEGDILFLATANEREWNEFEFKNDKIKPYYVSNIEEMVISINSCEMFIGNQSAPFAIASALDVPRLVELDPDPAPFYMNEKKYSDNISWFVNDNIKYLSSNCRIKF